MPFTVAPTTQVAMPGTGGKTYVINNAGAAEGTLATAATGVIGTTAGEELVLTSPLFGIAQGAWVQANVDHVLVRIEDLTTGAAAAEYVNCIKSLNGGPPGNLRLTFRNGGTAASGALRIILEYKI